MSKFNIDRSRALGLYDAGFHDLSDFEGKTADELMEIGFKQIHNELSLQLLNLIKDVE